MNIEKNRVVKFQRMHALLFAGIFIFILAAFIFLIARQNDQHVKYDKSALGKYFQDFKSQFDSKFFQIENCLRQIRTSAEADLLESRQNGVKLPFNAKFIKRNNSENYYHMDELSEKQKKEINVNVTGNGNFKNNGQDFDRILSMGLNLYDDFNAFKENLPNIIYIYYISTKKFMVHHPWVASSDYRFAESLYDYELWKQSLPENNPKKTVYWTDAYIDDSVGGGLMTTCAIPLYDQNKFIGLIGADLTVDFLNQIVKKFEPQRHGYVVIFDQKQNVLSHHNIISYKDKTIKKLKDVLPPELTSKLGDVGKVQPNIIIEAGNWSFIKSTFNYSPFSILYYFPRQTMFSSIIGRVGYGTLWLVISMLFLVCASLFVTHKELIRPTEKFVNFILAKSRGDKATMGARLPRMWKPWFSTIENVFDENAKLTENIKQSNLDLESKNIELLKEIDARNKAEAANEILEKQLIQEEKIKAIGLLAGGISHDFNNQLSIIMGYTSFMLAKADLPKEKQHECLGHIMSAANNSADLTRQLLAFAQKGNYQNIPINLHEMIVEVISILNHTIDKRIVIDVKFNAGFYTVNGDPAQIKNMIMNIAINAVNAMPDGGRIVFSTINKNISKKECTESEFEMSPGNYIKVIIADTGIGIEEEVQKRIFEPFFTTHNSGRGTGLGLAAAMGTIRNHKGSIAVKSVYGEGATFIVALPVLLENLLLKKSLNTRKSQTVSSEVNLLLIDDENDFCNMMSDFMTSLGYVITTYTDPLSAIEHYRDLWREIDLVITDMMMPKISGGDLIHELRKINPDVKVVISSGYSAENETRELLQNNKQILAFFKKPFNLIKFANDISKLIKTVRN